MVIKSGIVVSESISELKKIQSKQLSFKAEKRIKCLILLKLNKFKNQQEIADYLEVDRRTVVNWISFYKNGGIEGILLKTTRDKPSKLITSEIHEGLEKKVKDAENPLLGYKDALRWVRENYTIDIQYHWLRKYMIQHFKTKLKSPRKSHLNKDEGQVETFLKTT